MTGSDLTDRQLSGMLWGVRDLPRPERSPIPPVDVQAGDWAVVGTDDTTYVGRVTAVHLDAVDLNLPGEESHYRVPLQDIVAHRSLSLGQIALVATAGPPDLVEAGLRILLQRSEPRADAEALMARGPQQLRALGIRLMGRLQDQ